jgi:hypothetical protein
LVRSLPKSHEKQYTQTGGRMTEISAVQARHAPSVELQHGDDAPYELMHVLRLAHSSAKNGQVPVSKPHVWTRLFCGKCESTALPSPSLTRSRFWSAVYDVRLLRSIRRFESDVKPLKVASRIAVRLLSFRSRYCMLDKPVNAPLDKDATPLPSRALLVGPKIHICECAGIVIGVTVICVRRSEGWGWWHPASGLG